MTIRESTELWEKTYLSPYASCSCDSRGRDREEPECDIRPVYRGIATASCTVNRSGD